MRDFRGTCLHQDSRNGKSVKLFWMPGNQAKNVEERKGRRLSSSIPPHTPLLKGGDSLLRVQEGARNGQRRGKLKSPGPLPSRKRVAGAPQPLWQRRGSRRGVMSRRATPSPCSSPPPRGRGACSCGCRRPCVAPPSCSKGGNSVLRSQEGTGYGDKKGELKPHVRHKGELVPPSIGGPGPFGWPLLGAAATSS